MSFDAGCEPDEAGIATDLVRRVAAGDAAAKAARVEPVR